MDEIWKEKLCNSWQNRLIIKDDHIVFKGLQGRNITIPSVMFPLDKNNYKIFCNYNTEDFDDPQMEQICEKVFDKIKPEVGYCYSNSEDLQKALSKKGIIADTYVGWIFLGKDTLPLHHCFIVVDNTKVLDYGAAFTSEDVQLQQKYKNDANKDATVLLAEMHIQKNKLPNHQHYGFGKVDPFYFYIAEKCEPLKGKQIFNQLMKSYQNHISYQRMRMKDNSTPTQNLIRQMESGK